VNPNDPSKIIPRGCPPGTAYVKPFEFAIRVLAEYDMNLLQDRLRADVMVNGQPTGVYAMARVGDGEDVREMLEVHGPHLERTVADEFMGLGYRRRVQALENELAALKNHINRRRWWHWLRALRPNPSL
jgi:hypothetical protein